MNPTVYIKANDEIKVLSDRSNNIYLKDKTEFSFELFNPLQKSVLAVFYINGEKISNDGLVIRPAQRINLERYLDNDKKFLFTTYEVADNDPIVKAAIANNGSIKVIFYQEKIKEQYLDLNYRGGQSVSSMGRSKSRGFAKTNISYTNFNSSIDYAPEERFRGITTTSQTTTTETGRIEQGTTSNQQLMQVQMEFENFPLCTIEYKLLPESLKPTSTKFCGRCGLEQLKSNNFCTECGTKF